MNREAYNAGWETFANGGNFGMNPYPSDTPEWADWDMGFEDSQSDYYLDDKEPCFEGDDCPLDGDQDSTMESIGWGVDEVYDHYGEY